ncbi:MAG TPA: maleylpyruvate isomerase family mycothiol-dependent enzyme [Pedococcus sp.]|jgi:maleylpyruvate isomerase|nr:maleylpyruvate isomerase family mycothiol-dependent enzyme [Pedococcus sp.]
MEPSFSLDSDRRQVAEHTTRLLDTVAALEDASTRTLCEGWSRAHVVTHLARNAEAIGRLSEWALTGVPQEMYPGGTARRDAAIEEGSSRELPQLLDDLRSTASELAPKLDALDGDLMATEVELRGGLRVPAQLLAFLRLREVVFHHVDLMAGFTFDDVDDELLTRFIDDAVTRLGWARSAPAVELRADSGARWTLPGEGPTTVIGTLGGLMLWLARRDPTHVHVDGPVPELPRGA